MDFTIQALKIAVDKMEEEGLIEIINTLSDGILAKIINETDKKLNETINQVQNSGNEELKRQKDMGL